MRTHYSNEITQELDGREVTVSGWVHEVRDLGKLKFLILRDGGGFIQVIAKTGETDAGVLEEIDSLSRESVIEVTGIAKKNSNAPGGVEIAAGDIKVISRSQSPLPLDVTQKVGADMDTRLNNRFMDLRKPQVAAIFRIRSRVLDAGRGFLRDEGFVEINTPNIISSASEGGTELFPISYFDREAFLAQSPQLYKQMMMATGFDRVYETSSYFRAEEHDTRRHLNEVTAIDLEMSFIKDEAEVMDALENLCLAMIGRASECEDELRILDKDIPIPKKPIRRITYDEVLELLGEEGKEIPWGQDLDTESEKLLGELVRRQFNEDIYFITKYPLQIKPFYTMPDEKAGYSRAFDLGYKGVEISSGSQRIHDYGLLVDRMGYHKLDPESFKFYLDAFRYGMPPHGGFGLGVDRVMMQILDLPIREAVIFPRDRHRLTP